MSRFLLAFLVSFIASSARAELVFVGEVSLPFGSPTLIAGDALQAGAVYEYQLGTFAGSERPIALRARVTLLAITAAALTRLDDGTNRLAPEVQIEGAGHVDLQVDFVDEHGAAVTVSGLDLTVSGLAQGARLELTPPATYTVSFSTLVEPRLTTEGRYAFGTSAPPGASFERSGFILDYADASRLFLRVGRFTPGTATLSIAFGAPAAAFTSPFCWNPVCGNGRREPPENCDDGNALPGDGCDELCRAELALWLESPTGARRPELKGRGVPGESVTLLVDAFQGRVTTPEDGFWRYIAPIDLADGPHTITATTQDFEGRPVTLIGTLVVDTVTSVELLAPAPGAELVAGPIVVSGRAEEGGSVTVIIDGPTSARPWAWVHDGMWSVETPPLLPGRYSIRAEARDPIYNLGVSPTLPLTLVACGSDTDCVRGTPCQADGVCEYRPPCTCDDRDPCTEDRCEGPTGCTYRVLPRGTPCDGGYCDGERRPMCLECVDNTHCVGAFCRFGQCVDMVPPAVAIAEPVQGARIDGRWVTVRGTTEPGLALRVIMSGEPMSYSWDLVADADGAFGVTASEVPVGSYELVVAATDASGNKAEARSWFWIWPTPVETEPEPASPTPPQDEAGCVGSGAKGPGLALLGLALVVVARRARGFRHHNSA